MAKRYTSLNEEAEQGFRCIVWIFGCIVTFILSALSVGTPYENAAGWLMGIWGGGVWLAMMAYEMTK